MTTLAICNHKGGTGKTTTTVHTAAALGLSGYRTLVIDLDPQGFLSRYLGLEEPPLEASALVLFDPKSDLGHVPVQRLKNFDVLPASSSMTKALRKLNKPTDVFWAKECLEASTTDYDIVLFDTAAAVTAFSLNALVASQHVVIPVTPEYQPVYGAEQTYQTVSQVRSKLNPDLDEPRFLFTQVDGRKRNHQLFRRYMRNRYGELIMKSIIRTSAALAKAHDGGTTAFDNDPYSRGVRDYANSTDELLRLIDARAASTAKPKTERAAPSASAEPPAAASNGRETASEQRPGSEADSTPLAEAEAPAPTEAAAPSPPADEQHAAEEVALPERDTSPEAPVHVAEGVADEADVDDEMDTEDNVDPEVLLEEARRAEAEEAAAQQDDAGASKAAKPSEPQGDGAAPQVQRPIWL